MFEGIRWACNNFILNIGVKDTQSTLFAPKYAPKKLGFKPGLHTFKHVCACLKHDTSPPASFLQMKETQNLVPPTCEGLRPEVARVTHTTPPRAGRHIRRSGDPEVTTSFLLSSLNHQ